MKSTGNYFFVKKSELKENFTQIPNNIFSLDLKPMEKLILIYLFSNAENFRITNYRIKESVNCDWRTARTALNKFKKIGFIYDVNENTIGINISSIINYSTMSSPTMSSPTMSSPTMSSPTMSSPTHTIGSPTHSTMSSPTHTIGSPTHSLTVGELNNNTKQQEIKKEVTTLSNNTSEILVFGFSEVSFNSVQLKHFNSIVKFFVSNYKLTETDVKNYVINYYRNINGNIQELPIELNETSKDFGQKLLEYINQYNANKALTDTNTPINKNNVLNPIIEGKNESSSNPVKPIQFTKLFLGDDYLIYFQNKYQELLLINPTVTVNQFEEEIIQYLSGNQFSIDTIPNSEKRKIEDWIKIEIQLNKQNIKDMFYNIKEILQ